MKSTCVYAFARFFFPPFAYVRQGCYSLYTARVFQSMFSSGVTDYLLQGSCSPSAAGVLEPTCGSIITAYAEMGETKDFIVRSYLVRSYFIRSYFVICPCSFLVASLIHYTESKSHFCC